MIWLFFIIIVVVFGFYIYNRIQFRRAVSLFKRGGVSTTGLRGHGKDCLFCLVINARKRNYISNVQYSSPRKSYQRFDFDAKVWELMGNTPDDFINDTIKPFTYPYPDGIDYYISDAGVYFPSQEHKQLEKKYRSAPLFQALSRHLGDCSVHFNSQRLGRVWDKIREQSDLYIGMSHCWIPNRFNPFKFGHMKLLVYSKAESCEALIKPPFFGLGAKARDRKLSFVATHGDIKKISFFFRLPYKYDSRRFKRILENNCVDYEV